MINYCLKTLITYNKKYIYIILVSTKISDKYLIMSFKHKKKRRGIFNNIVKLLIYFSQIISSLAYVKNGVIFLESRYTLSVECLISFVKLEVFSIYHQSNLLYGSY
jgi:hypothetical protein